MNEANYVTVTDNTGLVGKAEAAQFEDHPSRIWILFEGRQLLVPAEVLVEQEDGSYHLPLEVARVSAGEVDEEAIIPVVEESAEVLKRRKETGRVRIHKTVEKEEEVVEVPLLSEEVEVERVPVDRVVDGPLPLRREGDTLIIPLLEEVLVVRKQFLLKEEVRITTQKRETTHQEQVTLRKERVSIEHLDPETEREGGIPRTEGD